MDVYLINLNTDENIERIELSKIQHKNSRLYLKKILNDVYKVNSDILEDNKRPYLKNNEKSFSISHSNKLLTIAFSFDIVGIDIEYKRKREFEKILKFFKANKKDVNEEEFFKIWTIYEAEYKSKIKENIKVFEYKNYILALSFKNDDKINFFEVLNDDYKKIKLKELEKPDIKIK